MRKLLSMYCTIPAGVHAERSKRAAASTSVTPSTHIDKARPVPQSRRSRSSIMSAARRPAAGFGWSRQSGPYEYALYSTSRSTRSGMKRREQCRQRSALRMAKYDRPLDALGIHHCPDIVDAGLGCAGAHVAIGQPGAALVELEKSTERCEALHRVALALTLPRHFEM